MTKPTIKRPLGKGSQSLDKRLEIEAEGGEDIHYHFHGRAEPLHSSSSGSRSRGSASFEREHEFDASTYTRAQPLASKGSYPIASPRSPGSARHPTKSAALWALLLGIGLLIFLIASGNCPVCK